MLSIFKFLNHGFIFSLDERFSAMAILIKSYLKDRRVIDPRNGRINRFNSI